MLNGIFYGMTFIDVCAVCIANATLCTRPMHKLVRHKLFHRLALKKNTIRSKTHRNNKIWNSRVFVERFTCSDGHRTFCNIPPDRADRRLHSPSPKPLRPHLILAEKHPQHSEDVSYDLLYKKKTNINVTFMKLGRNIYGIFFIVYWKQGFFLFWVGRQITPLYVFEYSTV